MSTEASAALAEAARRELERRALPKPKVVQIAFDRSDRLYALRDDGTMWSWDHDDQEWSIMMGPGD